MKQSGNARVVSVTSRAHRRGGIDFDDINFEKHEYNKYIAYAQSKSTNALFTVALDRVGRPHGVRAFSVHPGMIVTELWRHLSDDEVRTFSAHAITFEQGAATVVWCATSTQLDGKGGVYCEDVDISVDIPVNAQDALVEPGIVSWLPTPAWRSSCGC